MLISKKHFVLFFTILLTSPLNAFFRDEMSYTYRLYHYYIGEFPHKVNMQSLFTALDDQCDRNRLSKKVILGLLTDYLDKRIEYFYSKKQAPGYFNICITTFCATFGCAGTYFCYWLYNEIQKEEALLKASGYHINQRGNFYSAELPQKFHRAFGIITKGESLLPSVLGTSLGMLFGALAFGRCTYLERYYADDYYNELCRVKAELRSRYQLDEQ